MAAYWVVRVNALDAKNSKLCAIGSRSGSGIWWPLSGTRGVHETTEGRDFGLNVNVWWPDLSTAQTAYHSPEYQKARDVLVDGAERLFAIVDGLPD